VSSWWQLKPQCDFIPVLAIKTNHHEHFPYSTTRAILHQFVSPTPANLYTSTEDLSQSKPSTCSSMPGKSDPSHEAHESTPPIARPSQAYCTFREPFWDSSTSESEDLDTSLNQAFHEDRASPSPNLILPPNSETCCAGIRALTVTNAPSTTSSSVAVRTPSTSTSTLDTMAATASTRLPDFKMCGTFNGDSMPHAGSQRSSMILNALATLHHPQLCT
jgi:hypothetical protein